MLKASAAPRFFGFRDVADEKGEDQKVDRAQDEVLRGWLAEELKPRNMCASHGVQRHRRHECDCGQRRFAHSPAQCSSEQCKDQVQEEWALGTHGKDSNDGCPHDVNSVHSQKCARSYFATGPKGHQQSQCMRRVNECQGDCPTVGKGLVRFEPQQKQGAKSEKEAYERKHAFCSNQSTVASGKGKPATDEVQH